VDLSRQDEGDEMFGSSKAARALVRFTQNTGNAITTIMPDKLVTWINSRFNKNEVILTDDKAAFDLVRASINLVLSAMLITIGTNHKLPLSTTYITFMVAMGSSLADRAWSRESAVFRVTGVLSVIGGWFITAGVAFITCGIVCLIMYFGGFPVQLLFMALVIFLLIRSNRRYAKKEKKQDEEDDSFRLMMRLRDPELVWDLLKKHVSHTQSYENQFALKEYNQILNGLAYEDVRSLRHANRELKNEQNNQKKYRRQEMLGLKKSPLDIAVERNTWFHLGANANQQFLYSLRRMLDPIKEHVDNSFSPLPAGYVKEFQPMQQRINNLMKSTEAEISTGSYDNYREILAEADDCKDELSILRKKHLNRMQEGDNSQMQINLLYLNVLQESQEFLSVMRHQLRAAKKFMEN
jgi:Na+/phosphate symporter